ncbi:serine/threonine protein kinase [Fusarium proliferatum]|nr:serine/threonine protein kinase [Fusarium proliferatum]
MDTDQAVFYLLSENHYALDIIRHPKNSNRACQDPRDPKSLCLRIGLIQESKSPPYLVSFGRGDHSDVNDDDEDEGVDGEIKEEKLGFPLISEGLRQCVVLLNPDLYHDPYLVALSDPRR